MLFLEFAMLSLELDILLFPKFGGACIVGSFLTVVKVAGV